MEQIVHLCDDLIQQLENNEVTPGFAIDLCLRVFAEALVDDTTTAEAQNAIETFTRRLVCTVYMRMYMPSHMWRS